MFVKYLGTRILEETDSTTCQGENCLSPAVFVVQVEAEGAGWKAAQSVAICGKEDCWPLLESDEPMGEVR